MGVNRRAGAGLDVEYPHGKIQHTVVCGSHSPDLFPSQQSSLPENIRRSVSSESVHDELTSFLCEQ
jgi:hypothetical protein